MLFMFDRMGNSTAIFLVKSSYNHVRDTKSNVRCQQEKEAFVINQIIAKIKVRIKFVFFFWLSTCITVRTVDMTSLILFYGSKVFCRSELKYSNYGTRQVFKMPSLKLLFLHEFL